MSFSAEYISYPSTNAFSKITNDYVSDNILLMQFYAHPPTVEGIKKAITQRQKFPTNRKLLVDVLQKQYGNTDFTKKQQQNIQLLSNTNCFTITTAHQPNIFTGHLYFIYKILHAIKLAEYLQGQMPENNFVPVFYMGSEDADLEELNHIYIKGEKYEWKTNQTGAVGRMEVDKALIALIDTIAGQLLTEPYGKKIIDIIRECYIQGITIQQATFMLVNKLFANYGLLVIVPDDADLKRSFIPVIKKELTEKFSYKNVLQTVAALPKEYKVQASGRELNLFYLKEERRDRIEQHDSNYTINGTTLKFTEQQILEELNNHPERFSPNVILRPVFQEMILPNVAFVGGGGEIAYWLELKKVFDAVDVPYPVLVLRNSFLVLTQSEKKLQSKLKLTAQDLFKPEAELIALIVKISSANKLNLDNEGKQIEEFYNNLLATVNAVDVSLQKHTIALKVQALHKINALEKKMLRAEKRKFEAEQRQIRKLKAQLFPNNNLQEREENFMLFYAKWGGNFIETLFENSLPLKQEFCLLTQ